MWREITGVGGNVFLSTLLARFQSNSYTIPWFSSCRCQLLLHFCLFFIFIFMYLSCPLSVGNCKACNTVGVARNTCAHLVQILRLSGWWAAVFWFAAQRDSRPTKQTNNIHFTASLWFTNLPLMIIVAVTGDGRESGSSLPFWFATYRQPERLTVSCFSATLGSFHGSASRSDTKLCFCLVFCF